MLKHFTMVIKKKAAKQKDIEQVFTISIANFNSSEADFYLVRQIWQDLLLSLDSQIRSGQFEQRTRPQS